MKNSMYTKILLCLRVPLTKFGELNKKYPFATRGIGAILVAVIVATIISITGPGHFWQNEIWGKW